MLDESKTSEKEIWIAKEKIDIKSTQQETKVQTVTLLELKNALVKRKKEI